MTIQAGQQLLHYRLIERIGEGGMGVVWKALDTTLDRAVAIKILPEVLAQDPERLARFEREAKVLATLNHPNIAGVYGFHDAAGVRFLAMELVDGAPLDERLQRGALALDDALAMATQVAAALEAAHARGIVHRDLKPGNVVVSKRSPRTAGCCWSAAARPRPARGRNRFRGARGGGRVLDLGRRLRPCTGRSGRGCEGKRPVRGNTRVVQL